VTDFIRRPPPPAVPDVAFTTTACSFGWWLMVPGTLFQIAGRGRAGTPCGSREERVLDRRTQLLLRIRIVIHHPLLQRPNTQLISTNEPIGKASASRRPPAPLNAINKPLSRVNTRDEAYHQIVLDLPSFRCLSFFAVVPGTSSQINMERVLN
jgi:hypothetical protein